MYTTGTNLYNAWFGLGIDLKWFLDHLYHHLWTGPMLWVFCYFSFYFRTTIQTSSNPKWDRSRLSWAAFFAIKFCSKLRQYCILLLTELKKKTQLLPKCLPIQTFRFSFPYCLTYRRLIPLSFFPPSFFYKVTPNSPSLIWFLKWKPPILTFTSKMWRSQQDFTYIHITIGLNNILHISRKEAPPNMHNYRFVQVSRVSPSVRREKNAAK